VEPAPSARNRELLGQRLDHHERLAGMGEFLADHEPHPPESGDDRVAAQMVDHATGPLVSQELRQLVLGHKPEDARHGIANRHHPGGDHEHRMGAEPRRLDRPDLGVKPTLEIVITTM